MPTQNVNLSDHQSQYIRDRVERGRYQNVSEVVRAALRLLEQQEAEDELRLETLRRMVRDGFDQLDRGEHHTYTSGEFDQFLDDISRRVREQRTTK